MKNMIRWMMPGLMSLVVLSGCAKVAPHRMGMASLGDVVPPPMVAAESGQAENDMTEVRPDRMLIWKADLSMEVWSVSNAVRDAVALVEHEGGFVERKSDSGDASASLTLRIPSKAFKTALAGMQTLGTVTYRNVGGEDVTEQYIDIEARLKNKIVLRDRLKQLLEKATAVKDVLAIETELNRVQADIDSMEGRIKALKGRVDYATVNLRLERRPILGPLGYLFKGLFWGVGKLFVLRD